MHFVIKEILLKLENHGFSAYVVGGYVRDFLLNKESMDVDIGTNAKPNDLEKLFSLKTNSYGALHFSASLFHITITPFRMEKKYVHGKLIEFSYVDDLLMDLKRRDFTINAICMDRRGHLIDFYNGIEDIKNECIRMILDPIEKIEEDPLRILRAIRFSSLYDFEIEDSLKVAIQNCKFLLKDISLYRIKEELSKMHSFHNLEKNVAKLEEYDIMSVLNLSYTNLIYTKSIYGMWAQLKGSFNFPFTKKEKEHIVKIRTILDLGAVNFFTLYSYGLDCNLIAGEILGMAEDEVKKMYQNMPIYSKKDLKITREEIIECIPFETKITFLEEELITSVLNKKVKNNKQDLKEYLKQKR